MLFKVLGCRQVSSVHLARALGPHGSQDIRRGKRRIAEFYKHELGRVLELVELAEGQRVQERTGRRLLRLYVVLIRYCTISRQFLAQRKLLYLGGRGCVGQREVGFPG